MHEEVVKLQSFLNGQLNRFAEARILEAGCGSASHIRFKENSRIVGIDISEKQLEANKHLHEKILGDIQRHKFPPDAFDVIVCWNVLEHLSEPAAALESFFTSIRKDGIIILALPNLLSIKGLLTKCTPHRLHVLFYKHVKGWKEADSGGKSPFKTYFRYAVTPNALKKFASEKGLNVVYFASYHADLGKRVDAGSFLGLAYRKACRIVKAASLGKIGESELIMVFRK
jgi:SAM-dependent methyltransferase